MSEGDLFLRRGIAAAPFILSSAAFGAAASLMAVWFGSDVFLEGRFFALSYTIFIAVAAMALIGFFYIVLPPFINATRETFFYAIVYLSLTIGSLLMIGGFFASSRIVLFLSLSGFAVVMICRLFYIREARTHALFARFSLFGLLIAALLGINRGEDGGVFAYLHALWGIAGWTLLAIIGGAREFLPSLYGAKPYPHICCKIALPTIYFALLAAFPLAAYEIFLPTKICVALGAFTFSLLTIFLMLSREKTSDSPPIWYPTISVLFLLTSLPFAFIESEVSPKIFIVLFGAFALSFINVFFYGSLQKVYPLSSGAVRIRAIGFALGALLIAIAPICPQTARLGGALLAASYLLLLKDALLFPPATLRR
ncbi:MAG: hypothetical protein LBE89_00120 [Helicobacteraceae bacterium]|nr:hypothetical protein [Helicobacteraceae bacterium]